MKRLGELKIGDILYDKTYNEYLCVSKVTHHISADGNAYVSVRLKNSKGTYTLGSHPLCPIDNFRFGFVDENDINFSKVYENIR